jgi:uncharacterized protein YkwD
MPKDHDVRAARRPAVLALTTALLSASLLLASLLAAPGATAASNRETRLIAMINHARAVHGLPALRVKPALMSYAGRHSAAMAARHELYHTTNFGVVCCWSAIGENIAYNSTVRRVHRAFMRSPGHRANILNPHMRRVGVGIVARGGRLWVTEIFIKPA